MPCLRGYYFLITLVAQRERARDGFLGAMALGLGFFAKIDFVVILLGCGIALGVTYRREALVFVRRSANQCALCCLGFLLGAGPMILKSPFILNAVLGGAKPAGPSELLEKIHTAMTMYDGSYFFRLMNVGGNFETMFTPSCPVWSPFGVAVILSGILLAVHIVRHKGKTAQRQRLVFLLLSVVLITGGLFLLPGAVRIHHHLAVYPFPHLIVVAAILVLWQNSSLNSVIKWSLRACAVAMAVAVIGGHLLAVRQTQDLIAATGGRGHWSDAIEQFCDDLKDQHVVGVISLDWGFNEQLHYLCNNKRLLEPIWQSQTIPASSKCVYLVHPPEYTVVPAGWEYYRELKRVYSGKIVVRPYKDREGNVAFYAVRLWND